MGTSLDQLSNLKKIDKSDMLGDLIKTPVYCQDAIQRAKQVNLPEFSTPKNIVVIGMGGSAIGGELLKDWLRDTLAIPIEVNREYSLPAYVNENTLVFVNSYSGNTEETLTAFLLAKQRNCMILAITSGGLLEKLCNEKQVPYVKIPSGLQPRAALPYLFFPLPVLLERLAVLSKIENELQEAIEVVDSTIKQNAPSVSTKDNTAKQLATKLLGTMPVIYGFRQYTSVAHRLKAEFNENSKIHSKSNVFPELNHNETVGYESSESLNQMLSVILIRDPHEPAELKDRIETTTKLVLGRAKNVLEIEAKGNGKLAKMLSVVATGDYTSVYLAILQKIDPSPVKIIEKIKKELAKKKQNSKNL